jgi:hypothetical protein
VDIPIVFGVNENPVSLGLVASLARPGGNVTGVNVLGQEAVAKQLELLHMLVPKAVRVAVLVNPANAANSETTLRAAPDAARALGLEIQVLKASSIREIEAAFATLVRERADALFVGGDGFLGSRRVQLTVLSVRHGIPTFGQDREAVEAGMLMHYGTNSAYMYREVGVYTGRILKGAKPADLHSFCRPPRCHHMPATPAWGNQPRIKDVNEVTISMRQLTRSTKNMTNPGCCVEELHRCRLPTTASSRPPKSIAMPRSTPWRSTHP